MEKKAIIFGSLIVLVGAGLFLMFWRAQIMGPDAKRTPGGLVAVDARGTPMPLSAPQAVEARTDDNNAFQEVNGLLVSLMLDPYPPNMKAPGNFEVVLADAQGRLISDADVSIDLTMPGMWMPPNLLTLQENEAGTYRSSGHFTMRGLWRMEVIIAIDGKTQSAFFDVWL
jgi:hypothetical protein